MSYDDEKKPPRDSGGTKKCDDCGERFIGIGYVCEDCIDLDTRTATERWQDNINSIIGESRATR